MGARHIVFAEAEHAVTPNELEDVAIIARGEPGELAEHVGPDLGWLEGHVDVWRRTRVRPWPPTAAVVEPTPLRFQPDLGWDRPLIVRVAGTAEITAVVGLAKPGPVPIFDLRVRHTGVILKRSLSVRGDSHGDGDPTKSFGSREPPMDSPPATSSAEAADVLGPRLLVPIPESCVASGLSRSFLYEAMASGELRYVKVGRRRLIPRDALLDWVERLFSPPCPAAA